MNQENVTFPIDSEKKEALKAIANVTDRDLTYVLNEAIASYLEIYSVSQVYGVLQGHGNALSLRGFIDPGCTSSTWNLLYQWLVDEIKKGVAEAEAGDFASDNEVQAVFTKLTNKNQKLLENL